MQYHGSMSLPDGGPRRKKPRRRIKKRVVTSVCGLILGVILVCVWMRTEATIQTTIPTVENKMESEVVAEKQLVDKEKYEKTEETPPAATKDAVEAKTAAPPTVTLKPMIPSTLLKGGHAADLSYRGDAIPVVGISTISQGELLLRLVASLDVPVETLVVVRNTLGKGASAEDEVSVESAISTLRKSLPATNLKIIETGTNRGVSGSWNTILKTAFESRPGWGEGGPARYAFVIGDDVAFHPATLSRLLRFVDSAEQADVPFIMPDSAQAFQLWIARPSLIERVGYMDENFWPAYSEDCDMWLRISYAGANQMSALEPALDRLHGNPNGGRKSLQYGARLERASLLNQCYFRAKWGQSSGGQHCGGTGIPFQKFKVPFGNPNKTIKDWTLNTKLREAAEKVYDFTREPPPLNQLMNSKFDFTVDEGDQPSRPFGACNGLYHD